MLDSMRTLSKSIVSKLLMALLVVSFGIWGVGDILQGSGPSYAAKIDGDIVSVGEFQRQAAQLKTQLEEVGMKGVSRAQINTSALRQLVQQRLNLAALEDLGLSTNEAQVAKSVAAMPQFQDKETGKFSRTVYTATLKANGLSERTFIEGVKKEIGTNFLADSLSMEGVAAPESVLRLQSVINGETRDAVIFTIPARDAMDEKNAAALEQFYEENKATLYMTPERRSFEYVVLTKADLDGLVDRAITDAMVAETIKAKPELNPALARMKLRDEQRDTVMRNVGNSIQDALAAGKSLTESLAEAGITTTLRTLAATTAQAAATHADPIIKTVAEQGFGMGTGEVSGLISSKNGATLMVAVKEITPESPKPFAEVRADVAARMSKQLAREAAQAKAVSAKEALEQAPNWQAVAQEKNLATRVVSKLARPVDGKQIQSDLPRPLQEAIFERAVGQVAGPLALENGDQLLALVTASKLPQAIAEKPSLSAEAQQQLNARLARDIENRAYQSFATKHKVVINPAVIQAGSEAQ